MEFFVLFQRRRKAVVRVLPFCGRGTRFYESTDDATEAAQRNGCL